jgi:hypothetical protein
MSLLTYLLTYLFQTHTTQKETVLLQKTANDLGVKMDQVMQLEIEVKAKERKVLDREEEILRDEQKILALSREVSTKLDVILSLVSKVEK